MYMAIDFAGVREHLTLLEKEKKNVRSIQEDLQAWMQLASVEPDIDIEQCELALQKLKSLEKSIVWRMEYLDNLVSDFREISEKNQQLLEQTDLNAQG